MTFFKNYFLYWEIWQLLKVCTAFFCSSVDRLICSNAPLFTKRERLDGSGNPYSSMLTGNVRGKSCFLYARSFGSVRLLYSRAPESVESLDSGKKTGAPSLFFFPPCLTSNSEPGEKDSIFDEISQLSLNCIPSGFQSGLNLSY